MAEKRTKADKLQRNVERLATRDAAHRESEINDKRSEPAGKILGPTQLEDQSASARMNFMKSAAASTATTSMIGSAPKRRSRARA
jgi:hypothetical protein